MRITDDRKIVASTGGAISLSAIAAFIGFCCAGPWAVAILGVSGAVAMARWQPLSPYILVAAGAMLAWAFWRAYRSPPVCADGSCPSRASSRMKYLLWPSALLLILAFFAEDFQWLLIDPTPEGLMK